MSVAHLLMALDRWPRMAALRVRSLFRRGDVERELDEELQYHVERQTAENIRQGMPPAAARTAALRAIGGIELRKEQVRDTLGTRRLSELARDLGFACRGLRRAPGYTATVVLTLALGIGANTAMFTLLRGTLLKPLPYRHGERLVYLRQSAPGKEQGNVLFSIPEIADLRARAKSLSVIAEYSSGLPTTLASGDAPPARVRAGIVSGNYFTVMGVEPVLGRLTTGRDDGPSAARVVVLSYPYWKERFGGDPRVVGRTVRVNGQVSTVIGVVRAAPQYPGPADVFVNMVASPHHLEATMVTERTHRMTEVFARVAPGYTVGQARGEVERIVAAMARAHPAAYDRGARYTVSLRPLREALNERAARTFWLLMGAAAFVLLIACANVANLTLMRWITREREMLVRAALGAGKGRLRRLLVAENLVLALLGGALGVGVAFAGVRMLVPFAARLSPRAGEVRLDAVVLAVGLATSVAVAVALSFVPRVGGEGDLGASLTPAGRGTTHGRRRRRLQQWLVVGQLAVCMVLLTGAGLLVRTLFNLERVDSGFRTWHLLTVDLPLEPPLEQAVRRGRENLARYERIRDRVAALPGVERVGLGMIPPLHTSAVDFDVKADVPAAASRGAAPHAEFKSADPGYFAAAGIPLLRGRGFGPGDRRGTPKVVVLNQSFARQLFGDRDPVGRRVAWTGELLRFAPLGGEWRTVVGIVGDTRDGGAERGPTPTMWTPFAQGPIVNGALVVRTAEDPGVLRPALVRAIHQAAPGQTIDNVATLEQLCDQRVAPRRLNALLIASFGALALVIAMVGIAGVLAFSVSARTAEIGIRISLGADPGRVRRMILGEGGALLGAGLAVGLMVALGIAPLLRGLLFGVTPHDPLTFAAVASMLAAVGLAACWVPATRAARVDPAVALRAE